jgi:hypothetical protein
MTQVKILEKLGRECDNTRYLTKMNEQILRNM